MRALHFIDTCTNGGMFTVQFYNLAEYPIDVIWINSNGNENIYKANLAPKQEYGVNTYFNHHWRLNKTGSGIRLYASANGVKRKVFEGCKFGAVVASTIRVEVLNGSFIFNI